MTEDYLHKERPLTFDNHVSEYNTLPFVFRSQVYLGNLNPTLPG